MIELGWKVLAMLCIGIASGVLSVVMPIATLSLGKFVGTTVGWALVFGGMEAFMKAIDARIAKQQSAPALAPAASSISEA